MADCWPTIHHEVRDVEVIQVVRVTSTRGSGEHPDPFREVVSYWTLEGGKVVEVDPCHDDPGGE